MVQPDVAIKKQNYLNEIHQSKATDYFIHEFMHEALENSQSHSYL